MAIPSTYLRINRSVLKSNLQYFRHLTGRRVMAVVKGNAYGHGLIEAGQLFSEQGADFLGVARAEEALELRQFGINTPILVLGYVPPEQATDLIAQDISLAVYDPAIIAAYAGHAACLNKKALLHVKIDTGMSRLGVTPQGAKSLLANITNNHNCLLEGVFTHFAKADETDTQFTEQQIEKFKLATQQLSNQGVILHAANSAAALTYTSSYFDMVRIGIALYGLHPSDEIKLPSNMKPALSWYSTVTMVKPVAAGTSVSYNGIFTAKRRTILATIAGGYADGLHRIPHHATRVLIHGKSVTVVGKVCMDQCVVDVTELSDVKIGDEVVIIGSQLKTSQSADDLAGYWKTNNYEVLTGLAARLPRLYTD